MKKRQGPGAREGASRRSRTRSNSRKGKTRADVDGEAVSHRTSVRARTRSRSTGRSNGSRRMRQESIQTYLRPLAPARPSNKEREALRDAIRAVRSDSSADEAMFRRIVAARPGWREGPRSFKRLVPARFLEDESEEDVFAASESSSTDAAWTGEPESRRRKGESVRDTLLKQLRAHEAESRELRRRIEELGPTKARRQGGHSKQARGADLGPRVRRNMDSSFAVQEVAAEAPPGFENVRIDPSASRGGDSTSSNVQVGRESSLASSASESLRRAGEGATSRGKRRRGVMGSR